MDFTNIELARAIDHTILKPETTTRDIVKLCAEAREYGFKAVCVQPSYVGLCVKELKDSEVCIATVIGFPQGASCKEVKVFEAKCALNSGAKEVDMVINIGALKSGYEELVYEDIKGVVDTALGYPGSIVKVIIETCLLNREEKVLACRLAVRAGAQYVKTSTGFAGGGATLEDIRLMSAAVQGKAKIKASGGIRTRQQAEEFLRAGAHRLGTSSGVAIIKAL
jgi:deoxyribose-phosphate aldolase